MSNDDASETLKNATESSVVLKRDPAADEVVTLNDENETFQCTQEALVKADEGDERRKIDEAMEDSNLDDGMKPSSRRDRGVEPDCGHSRVEIDSKENDKPEVSSVLPNRPIKKARTAYFIFAEDKREEIKAKHPGESVGILARETGQMWSALTDEEKREYQERAAEERERVAQELAKYKLDGIEVNAPGVSDPNALILPVARIRKICKLDTEVHGISKEAALLITKCAELATSKLGQECVKVAQLQNRRKLLPEDVAQVCATRESFLFLRDDVKDLVRDQKKENGKLKPVPTSAVTAALNSKPLTAYFGGK